MLSLPAWYSTTEEVGKLPAGAQFCALFAQLVDELGKAYWVAAYGYGTGLPAGSIGLAKFTFDTPKLADPTKMQDDPANPAVCTDAGIPTTPVACAYDPERQAFPALLLAAE